MRFHLGRKFVGAVAVTLGCLVDVAVTSANRATPQQNRQDRVTMTDDVFRSVSVLKGIPVDTFFESMGMFASAMGDDCTFCHVKSAYFDKKMFAEPTPRIARARQMIAMMNTINANFFGGQHRVTCFTCHGGSSAPRSEPDLALQYGPPIEDPNSKDFPVDPRFTASQLFDKYLEAVGGTVSLAKVSSFVAKGTYSGFDTGFREVPVDIFAKTPDQRTVIAHMFSGDSVRVFDGRVGWMAGPDTPLPLLTLTGGNLDRARLEAIVSFPSGIREAFNHWRVGRTVINNRPVQIVQGIDDDRQPCANFYFDQAGLLVRLVRWTETPVGRVPTQVDYDDYRTVGDIKMPFRSSVTQTYMQMIIQLSDVQPNVSIDASRFAQPAPVTSVVIP